MALDVQEERDTLQERLNAQQTTNSSVELLQEQLHRAQSELEMTVLGHHKDHD